VVLYSCASGQLSEDDSQRGGVYSYNLIDCAEKWANNNETNTNFNFDIMSVVAAHNIAKSSVERIEGDNQTPQIEKPRSTPYFPFCIVA
jgi:hypothetical protein